MVEILSIIIMFRCLNEAIFPYFLFFFFERTCFDFIESFYFLLHLCGQKLLCLCSHLHKSLFSSAQSFFPWHIPWESIYDLSSKIIIRVCIHTCSNAIFSYHFLPIFYKIYFYVRHWMSDSVIIFQVFTISVLEDIELKPNKKANIRELKLRLQFFSEWRCWMMVFVRIKHL